MFGCGTGAMCPFFKLKIFFVMGSASSAGRSSERFRSKFNTVYEFAVGISPDRGEHSTLAVCRVLFHSSGSVFSCWFDQSALILHSFV